MSTPRILAAALGTLVLLGTADASAARRRDRHPGHHARVSIATYTVPVRPPVRVLRTAQGAPQGTRALRMAYARSGNPSQFAQTPRRHALMRGS